MTLKRDLVRLGSDLVPGTESADLVLGSGFPKGKTGNWNQEPSESPARDRVPSTEYQVGVRGGSGDPVRGSWCTPKPYAEAVGPFWLDPFSNPRSHIQSEHRCMLEDGGDGFGDGTPGSYRIKGPEYLLGRSLADDRVWLQPPYGKGFVQRAFRHYRHTRWVALLRFDPRPPWWQEVYDASELVAVVEIEFEPPPGVKLRGGNSFPHAIYYRHAGDVTPAVLRMAAAVWRKKSRG